MAWLIVLALQTVDTVDQLDAADPATREAAEHALGKAGERARTLLEPAAKGGTTEGATRARRLLRLLDILAATPPVILEHVPDFREVMRAGSAEDRRALLFGKLDSLMGGYSADGALQGLYRAALSDPDPANCVLLAAKLESDPDGRVASIALRFLRDPDAGEYESLRADGKPNPDLIRAFEKRLVVARTVTAKDLEALLTNSNAFVRETAVEALRGRRHWDACPSVEPLLDDPYGFVIVAALNFLNEAGRSPTTERCLKIVREQEEWAAGAAVWALVRRGAKEAAPELLRLSRDRTDATFAVYLLGAASQLDPPLAEGEALRLARICGESRSDDTLRAFTAAACLARLHRPEHVTLVLEVVRKAAKAWPMSFSHSDPLAKDLAQCAATGALDPILDLCKPDADRWRRVDYMSALGEAVCDALDPARLTEACLGRVQNASLDKSKRLAAAQILAGLTWRDANVREAVIALASDRRLPPEVRKAFFGPLFGSEPRSLETRLKDLAANILRDAHDPVRMDLVTCLLTGSCINAGALLAKLFQDDINLAIPLPRWGYGRIDEALTAVIRTRLRSENRGVVLAALEALQGLRGCNCDEEVARHLIDGEVDVRRLAAAIVRMRQGTFFREALRRAAAKESDDIVLGSLFETAMALNDRAAFELLAVRVKPATAMAWACAMVRLGPRDEILKNERRLLELAPTETVEAIARVAPGEALRIADWAIRSQDARVRAAGARVIGTARIDALLPELRAMAISELQEVRETAFRALGMFDRSVWLPAWKSALECPGYDAVVAMCAAVAEKGDPDLARTLLPLLREHARDWLGPAFARAIDACVNGKALASWSSVKLPSPATLAAIAADLRGRELKAEISESALAYASNRLASSSDAWAIEVDSTWRRFTVGFAHVSSADGVRLMTIEEASDYWERALP